MEIVGDAILIIGGVFAFCSLCGVISYIVDVIQAKLSADAEMIADRKKRLDNSIMRSNADFEDCMRFVENAERREHLKNQKVIYKGIYKEVC